MRANKQQAKQLAPMVKKLWPEHSLEALERILSDYICGRESAAFTACVDGVCVGVALCCLRHDYVEGCDTSPVGYLEGIYVDEGHRRRGLAHALCGECEAWAKEQGCTEFASDCELTNTASLRFHLGIGFHEENRIICFKKTI
ncbi:MAG: GNAT family N-acetyltransferase [Oscillospiraceae bacterium]|nr:GNAT family N-acetyltransferase [Oscillospiraceae bacterium]